MKMRKRLAQLLENSTSSDRPSRILNLALIVLIMLNVLAIFAETEESIYLQYQEYFWRFEVFSVAIFSMEYIARVWSSVDLVDNKETSDFVARIKYMLTPMALIDLIAILPFYLSLYLSIDLRFLRVLRMLRMFKLTRYSPAMGAMLDVIQKESDSLIAAIVILLMMLVIASSGIYLLEHDVQPDTFGSIPDAMWWAMITLTTVGYGDVVPLTTMGKIFAGVIGLIGVGMVALPAAILASGFAENLNHRKTKYNNFLEHALRDGRIDEEERWQLEQLRNELDLDSDQALTLLDNLIRHGNTLDKCPHCGKSLRQEE